ncbi:MAG: membrane protein insertion efficiency factor YidD [Christensenellaceae bacterium]|jgi:putative membrane protein insertion efficiency factor|nr:membrane protein insertion efficiency factor YidD [Christensenellaceae bacterium]
MKKLFIKICRYARNCLVFVVLLPVYLYRIFISPLIGHSCHYQPTCSRYMIEAVKKRGIFVGVWLGVKRICRCNPWNKNAWGYDPVPEKKSKEKSKKREEENDELAVGGKDCISVQWELD